MLVATWNVNSIRSRIDHVKEWLITNKIDILCLQETKTEDYLFPVEVFSNLGYEVSISGQKSYNGVAIISKFPINDIKIGFDKVISNHEDLDILSQQKRIISAEINDMIIINVYVPNGSSIDSDKFIYKVKWLECLKLYLKQIISSHSPICLLGDFNIAPEDKDIHTPSNYEESIMTSSKERKLLKDALGEELEDVFRIFEPGEKHWSWWDYRHSAWERDKGWRIDHIYLTEDILSCANSCWIDKEPRSKEKPSDHAPVIVDISWPPSEIENEFFF
ncbi:exodeoxyribonuclease III [Prochlorococcus marinus]|uniref:Exodeoxyribonuclease III n=1 Tax=Prochlorococcus marinus XMU1408 TaxID=2213228 RepID=A0A318R378_PROMR|nr:exodeoxyribonuclease III [Prochlorococcus marinus]MBW3041512.1 exodeoxyribonuclease III [Prochlorococcus marinus str. XMU1408]PYE02670.1 exodeoxyribonuclease III [Prochlorococcus marinus XMU1408]